MKSSIIFLIITALVVLTIKWLDSNYVPPEVEKPQIEQFQAFEGVSTQEPEATVTAYCLNGIMASGLEVYDGAIACPRNIPLKTEVVIDDKLYICEDRLAKRFDDRFDIWMSDCNQAIQWGKQTKTIYIFN